MPKVYSYVSYWSSFSLGINLHTSTHKHTHINIQTLTHTHTCAQTHAQTHMHVHIYTPMNTHTRMHARTHTHTHTTHTEQHQWDRGWKEGRSRHVTYGRAVAVWCPAWERPLVTAPSARPRPAIHWLPAQTYQHIWGKRRKRNLVYSLERQVNNYACFCCNLLKNGTK